MSRIVALAVEQQAVEAAIKAKKTVAVIAITRFSHQRRKRCKLGALRSVRIFSLPCPRGAVPLPCALRAAATALPT
jgi:hypothetical protein